MTDIIFVHGFLGSNHDFKHFEDFCKLNKLQPYFISLPVHANSSPMNKYSLKDFAEFIFQYCTHKGLENSIFWGYSMGGRILLELFNEHPELFKALVLESTNPGIQDFEKRKDRFEKDTRWAKLLSTDFSQFIEEWYSQDLFMTFKGSSVFKETIKKRLSNFHPDLAKVLIESSPGTNPDYYDVINNLTAPCLALVGEKDDNYKLLWQKRFEKNGNIDIRIVPEAGHVLHLENPEAAKNILKEFLQKKFMN